MPSPRLRPARAALLGALLPAGAAWADPDAPADDEELTLEVTPAPAPAPPVPPPSPVRAAAAVLRGVEIGGYVQAQGVTSQLSEDEVSPDGDPLNLDRFSVRRGRIQIARAWEYARVDLEIDANTVNGLAVTARTAEATLLLPDRQDPDSPPVASLAAGLGDIPFGAELLQPNRDRLFMERSTASRAFFVGDPDVGVRAAGALGPVRYAVAAQNGVPLSDSPSADTHVYTHGKTLVGRLGFAAGNADVAVGTGGVSLLSGKGLHAGSPATKSQLLWSDANQDGNVTLDELQSVNGQAATPSETFARQAVNADLGLSFASPLGWSELAVEATIATNLDRGLYVADPVSTGRDLRELGWVVSATQEILERGIVGFRADAYDPDSDLFEQRHGDFVPVETQVLTLSPVVGVEIPDRGRFVVQYDYVADHLGRDVTGGPIDVPNDTWTARLQLEF